jgi:hypothetical protein
MSKIWIPGSGGGADLDVITAQAGDILAGKVIVDPDGEPLTGTMPNNGAVSKVLPINGSYTIPAGYHNGSGKVTQSIPTRGAATIIPSTANQTAISAGYYASGNVIVAGDPNLQAGNIKKGARIFGVTGTFEGLVTSPYYLWRRGSFQNGQSMSFGNRDSIAGAALYILSGSYFNNFVDLTNHRYLKTVVKGASRGGDVSIYVQNPSNGNTVATLKVYAGAENEITGYLDISSLRGQYKIFLSFAVWSSRAEAANYYEVFLANE